MLMRLTWDGTGTGRVITHRPQGNYPGAAWAVRYPLVMASYACAWHRLGLGMGIDRLRSIASYPAPIDGTWRACVRSHHTPPPQRKSVFCVIVPTL